MNPSCRALEFRIPPEGVGAGSAWERFFEFLYARYHLNLAASGRFVHAFELVNEPNWQLWPQRAPSGTDDPLATAPLTVQHTMAQQMATARAVAARHGDTTLLLAPSTADAENPARNVTRYDEFAPALLDALEGIGHTPRADGGMGTPQLERHRAPPAGHPCPAPAGLAR